ncbi:30S ribosomal protein S7 [bacterium]|nr:30S ribosomal protein S7 [bacterium]
MSRRREAKVRVRVPDPRFGDRLIARLISSCMLDGKKSLSQKIVYTALDMVAEKMKDDPIKVLRKALDNVKPVVETKSRRVGGANYQVPMEVRPNRAEALGIRWLLKSSRDRSGKSMAEKLANELMDAHAQRGAAVKKREEVHKMAEANKAFAHYRW